MKVDNLLKVIIFLMTLKIASPFGVFFITFTLPIALSIFVFITVMCRVSIKKVILSSVLPVLLLIFSWLFLFVNVTFPIQLYAHYFYVTSIVAVVFCSVLINAKNDIFYDATFWVSFTRYLILFHGTVLIVQVVLYKLIGFTLDFGALTGGNEIRANYIFNGANIFRPSGIFEEPSIFSAYMYSFLVIRFIFNGNRIDKYVFFGSICMLMTWSAMAIVLVSLFYTVAVIRFNVISILISLFFLGAIAYFSFDFIALRYENTMSGLDPSNLTKLKVITGFFNDRELFYYGYGIIRKNMFYGLDGLGDTTVYTSLITIFGVFLGGGLTLTLLAGIFFSKLSLKEKILFCSLFIKFAWPGYVFFWFLFSYAVNMVWYSKDEKNTYL